MALRMARILRSRVAHHLNPTSEMLRSALAATAALLLLAACRGEPAPRDYQNNPPAMTHPATTSSQTPAAHGMPGAAPEPSKGVEGQNPQRKPVTSVPATPPPPQNAPTTTT
jgi:hypothetical protein